MAVDPPSVVASTGRGFPDNALSFIADTVPMSVPVQLATQKWKHNGTDAAFKSDDVLTAIYAVVSSASAFLPDPKTLVHVDRFKTNVTKKSASGFIDLLREAVNGNNDRLWCPVVTHGTPLT